MRQTIRGNRGNTGKRGRRGNASIWKELQKSSFGYVSRASSSSWTVGILTIVAVAVDVVFLAKCDIVGIVMVEKNELDDNGQKSGGRDKK